MGGEQFYLTFLREMNAPEYNKKKKTKERKNKLTKPKFERKIEENTKKNIEIR